MHVQTDCACQDLRVFVRLHACLCLSACWSQWLWSGSTKLILRFFFHWESFVQMAKKLWKCCHRYFWPRFVLSARHTPFVLQVLFFPPRDSVVVIKDNEGVWKKQYPWWNCLFWYPLPMRQNRRLYWISWETSRVFSCGMQVIMKFTFCVLMWVLRISTVCFKTSSIDTWCQERMHTET